MFREIRKHEKINDRYEEKELKGFMNIKPNGEPKSLEELQKDVYELVMNTHNVIMSTM